jgi:hypothetical protein
MVAIAKLMVLRRNPFAMPGSAAAASIYPGLMSPRIAPVAPLPGRLT